MVAVLCSGGADRQPWAWIGEGLQLAASLHSASLVTPRSCFCLSPNNSLFIVPWRVTHCCIHQGFLKQWRSEQSVFEWPLGKLGDCWKNTLTDLEKVTDLYFFKAGTLIKVDLMGLFTCVSPLFVIWYFRPHTFIYVLRWTTLTLMHWKENCFNWTDFNPVSRPSCFDRALRPRSTKCSQLRMMSTSMWKTTVSL
jgi:hypothetical protein